MSEIIATFGPTTSEIIGTSAPQRLKSLAHRRRNV
jgi:hypothetical protein